MKNLHFWQKPHDANKIVGNENRKVSWLELFFDIFFVCAIAVVGHILVKEMNLYGFRNFVLTFIPIWWIWIGFTYYNERFETFGFENRFFTFLMMIPVAGLAVFAGHAAHGTFINFVLSYAVARFILGFLFGRAGYFITSFRVTGYTYAICFFISVLTLVLMVLFVPKTYYLYYFIAVILFDLLVPFIAGKLDGTFKKGESLNFSNKVNERFGLFSIIVIGEIIVAVINGLSELEHPKTIDLILGVLYLAIGFGMWWIYFDFISRRGPGKTTFKTFIWSYLHMPLVMSYIALGAGVYYAIEHPVFIDANRLLIGFSSGMILLLIGLIELVSYRHKNEPTKKALSSSIKFVTGTALMSIALFTQLEKLPFIILILVALAINMTYGLWAWFHQADDSAYETEYIG